MDLDEYRENVDCLLSSPIKKDSDADNYERCSSDYENSSSKFLRKDRSYARQYAHLYTVRLLKMRKVAEKSAKGKWGKNVKITPLCNLVTGEDCVIIGTLYKDMHFKPSVLKQIANDQGLIPQPVKQKFIDESDELILEDELQRISLQGSSLDVQAAVTGSIIAVKGVEQEDCPGKFVVNDICWPCMPVQTPWPELQQDCFVAIMSGLELGSSSVNSGYVSLQLLTDLLTGCVGAPNQQRLMSHVSRLIIAGNSLNTADSENDAQRLAEYLGRKSHVSSVLGVQQLDTALAQLTSSICVDLMPGEHDPANRTIPQQPMSRCLLPQAAQYSSLTMCTNPHSCSVDGVKFLGSSGQPVRDVTWSSSWQDPLDVMEQMLNWSHIAPTAPDTLACYPYRDDDPFVLDDCPHVFFTGNCDKFDSRQVTGPQGQQVLLIAVPRLSTTGTCCLVNLKQRTVIPLSVSTLLE